MKIGLSSAAYYGQLETDESAAHIAELPLDTCEVFLETPSEYTTDFTFRMRYNMNNFPVTSVHPLGTQFEPQLFGRAARQSDDAFAMFANVCRAAESLGAAYYIFHGPFGVRGHLSPANIPFLEERFDQMRERAGAASPARAVGERQLVQRRHAGGRAHPSQTHPGRGVRT